MINNCKCVNSSDGILYSLNATPQIFESIDSEMLCSMRCVRPRIDPWDWALNILKDISTPSTPDFDAMSIKRRQELSKPLQIKSSYKELKLIFPNQDFSTESGIRLLLTQIPLDKNGSESLKKNTEIFLTFCNEFLNQNQFQSFDDYLEETIKNVNLSFLQQLDAKCILELNQLPPSLKEQALKLNSLVFSASYPFYGFKKSDWSPNQPFENFVQLLKKVGPQILRAKLSSSYYYHGPINEGDEILDQPMSTWKKHTYTTQDMEDLRERLPTLIVIGAGTSQAKNFVYYVDSMEIKPKQDNLSFHSIPKLYATRYKHLQKNVIDLNGNASEKAISQASYSLYHSNFSPKPNE